MGKNNISILLDSLAKTGVCKTGRRYLAGTSKDLDVLIKVWRSWAEYLYEHSSLAIKLFRKYIDEETRNILADNWLFIDYSSECDLSKLTDNVPIFFVGDCDCNLIVPDYKVAKVYVFNASHITAKIGHNAYLNVETWDNAQFEVLDNQGKCVVYKYDHSVVSGDANVIQKEYHRGSCFNGQEL